jgi:predicted transcriptional regulator
MRQMSKITKQALVDIIKEVLQENKTLINEFNPKTGKFSDETFDNNQKRIVSEKISKFGNYQKYIASEASDIEVAEDICNIVESASKYILNETGDWFDAISVKRNLKEVRTLAKQFYKVASERNSQTQRMQSLYEDMGNILNRYFDISEEQSNES